MKTLDSVLYIEFREAVDAGISQNSMWKAKTAGYRTWSFLDDPEDKRKVLVEYEVLSDKYKDLITNRYGNPYDYVAKQPIKNMVKYDHQAERFYLEYTYGEDQKLTKAQVDKYTKAACWLNMLNEVTEDKRALKAKLNLTIDQFYTHVSDLILSEDVCLPRSYRKLLARQKSYRETKYASLISPHFGNSRSAKVNDELSKSVLIELIAHPNQFDDVFIKSQYNQWAKSNGYKEITAKAVGVHRRSNEELLTYEREGMSAFKDKFSKKIRGFRPTQPLYLVENDDNHIDLFFRDGQGNDYIRPKAIVVMDAFNNYVLGYAYALNITKDLVRAAYIDAMYHIKSLTGEWCLPHETKSDRWAIKDLKPFYNAMGHYQDARLGNKHRGYIEQFFGSPHWKNCLKLGANNYSGNNITASKRGVNADKLADNKIVRPFLSDGYREQMETFFHNLRHIKQENGLSKQQEWLQAWNQLDPSEKRIISDEQFLMKFGIEHNYRGNGVQITSKGVDVRLNGQKHFYELPEYNGSLVGLSVSIKYDPNDMSRVLLTNDKDVRIIARTPELAPRAIADYTTDTARYLKEMQTAQTEHAKGVISKSTKRKDFLRSHTIDAESILQAGILEKSQRQLAESQYNLPPAQDIEHEDLDDDFNPFDQL